MLWSAWDHGHDKSGGYLDREISQELVSQPCWRQQPSLGFHAATAFLGHVAHCESRSNEEAVGYGEDNSSSISSDLHNCVVFLGSSMSLGAAAAGWRRAENIVTKKEACQAGRVESVQSS